MCGICIWARPDGGVDGERLARAIELLRHRGPDSRNIMLWDGTDARRMPADAASGPKGGVVGLAHSRLSIIDLTEENDQPFRSDDGNLWLTYNGEVYNYIELREEMDHGTFATSGDTEVLLRLLQKEGLDALKRLNGMWAFGLFDAKRRRIIVSRDRYGKKPLFFYKDDRQFAAASEYKALFEMLDIPRQVEPDYLHGFLLGKRWPVFDDMRSMYRGIGILPAGAALVYELDTHDIRIVRDNTIDRFADKPFEGVEAFARDVESAVSLRLRSDVPVGVLVSGGVDSTAVSAMAAEASGGENLSFYTLKLDNDDLHYSRRVAQCLGVRLVEVEGDLDPERMERGLARLTRQLEIPINAGLVTLPGYLVLKRMAEDGVRVALDGTGGDEVLGGYPGYYEMACENAMRAGMWGKAFELKRLLDQREDTRSRSFIGGWLRYFRRTAFPGRRPPEKMVTDSRAEFLARFARRAGLEGMRDIIGECFGRDRMTDVSDMQLFDLMKGQIPYYLYINDQVSMINSIETRSPFMDYRLAGYVNMPVRYKFRDGFNKYLLRKVIPDSIDDDIRWRMAKAGFKMSLDEDRQARRQRMLDMVRGSELFAGLFDMDALLAGLAGREDESHFRELLEHMYSIALLEREVGLKLGDGRAAAGANATGGYGA